MLKDETTIVKVNWVHSDVKNVLRLRNEKDGNCVKSSQCLKFDLNELFGHSHSHCESRKHAMKHFDAGINLRYQAL